MMLPRLTQIKSSLSVVAVSLFSALTMVDLTYASVDELENNLESVIAESSQDFVNMRFEDNSYSAQFKRMIDNDFVIPSISFDPNSRFEFSIDRKLDTSHTKGFIDIDDKISATGKLEDLNTAQDDSNHIQNYISYKCSLEQKKMEDLGNINMNLSVMVDEILEGISDMENDIKSSISQQVSQTFQSLSSFFSPEYAFEMIFRKIVAESAKAQCTLCKEANLVGCNGIFLLAEAYKAPADEATSKELTDSLAKDTQIEKDKGSIVDWTWGVSCTTKSALATPSGIHFAQKIRRKSINNSVEGKYEELSDDVIDGAAWETCTEDASRQFTDKVNKALGVLIGSIEMRTRTQASCMAENTNDSVILQKRLDLKEEQGKIFFASINNKIADINMMSQSYTDSVVDDALRLESFFYGKPKDADKEQSEAMKALLKEQEQLDAAAVGNVYFSAERAKEFLYKEDSSSNALALTETLIDTLSGILRVGEHHKLRSSEENAIEILFSRPEDVDRAEFIKDDILALKAEFERDIDFYTTRIWTELSKPMPEDTSVYSCKKFEKDTLDEVRKCYFWEEVNRFQTTRAPATCDCTEFGFSQDLTPPMLPFFKHLEEEIDPDGIYKNYSFTTADSFKKRYRHYLKYELLQYIDVMRSHIINLKAKIDYRLTTLPIAEQQEVQRLFRDVSGIFR